jgi:hypothetical protein
LACSAQPGWGAGSSAGGGRGGADAANLDYQAGPAAAKAKDWTQVVARMGAMTQRDLKNADAWNELGHAHRQLGDMDNSFKNYARARATGARTSTSARPTCKSASLIWPSRN